MKTNFYQQAIKSVKFLQDNNLLPFIPIIETAHRPIVSVGGKKYLLFSSNSYLGLNVHKKVIDAAKKAIDIFGTGGGNSRLLSGTLSIHKEVEKTIAWFKKTDDAIVFPAGFMVNVGLIPALVNVFTFDHKNNSDLDTVIFSDEYNHASIIEGCKLSRSVIIKYKHCDIQDLNTKMNSVSSERNTLIVTDGVFSLDGDIAPLDKIVELAKKYKSMVMVDDAHGTGILGKTGRGIVEHFDIEGEIDVMMGTFSKALASAGGFVAGEQWLIDYLRIAVRTYLFTASLPPSVAATVIAALHVIDDNPDLIAKVRNNAEIIRSGFCELGFDIMNTMTPVIPMLIGNEMKAIKMSQELFNKGIIAPAVRYPAVPKGTARIRFTASSLHTSSMICELLIQAEMIGKKLNII